ncbi:MAG: 16S rRNA (guanine(966)-N(2))-methyltransferase RsmD [Desulfobacterales bacterium]
MGLRIISGRLRGRKIQTPPGLHTRPTADRLRESIFNILGERVENACVLDLYAGSGALGIEALSRGARFAVFIDNDKKALDIIGSNIRSCALEGRSTSILWDIRRNLKCIQAIPEDFDMVFMDPPYRDGAVFITLKNLVKTQKPAMNAIIVAEHAAGESIFLCRSVQNAAHFPGLSIMDQRTYGNTTVTFLEYEKRNARKD